MSDKTYPSKVSVVYISTYLLLNDIPLLAAALCQGLPYLFSHGHVFLAEALEFASIPVIGSLALHQTLVALPAGISSLAREVVGLNLAPVLTSSSSIHKCLVILSSPSTRRSAMMCQERSTANRTTDSVPCRRYGERRYTI
jgi:hypothetical protein